MVTAPRTVGTCPRSDGWAELADAEWAAARASFEAALRREETPEALEGLSWAAWWLDDADVVFDARERAYHLYRLGGEPVSAARMATWLAADQLDFRSATAVAGGWLRRAGRLLEGIETRPEHGWLAFHEGYLANLAGETARAAELGDRAAEVGRRSGVPDLEMLGLSLQGTTLVACAEVDEGMRRLDEAKAMAGEATIPISGAWACCFLVSACTAVLDYGRAFEWCDSIATFAERYGSRYILAFCRAEYGAIHLWRGQWGKAEEMLQSAIQDFGRSRPAMLGGPLVALAELRRRQTRTGEAVELLDRAGPSGAALLCRARIALDEGEPGRAVELVERLLRRAPAERKVDRAPAVEHLFRCRLARGELAEARVALDALRDVERLVRTEPLRAATEAAEGLLEAAAGEHERARVLLEDAVDRFQRCGAPFEAARTRIELATSLLALGRAGESQGEAAAARVCLLELGATGEAMRAGRLVEDAIRTAPHGSGASGLTPREREVLALLVEGLSNRQIAERLVVSEHTVHHHVTNLLRKLDLPSRTAAAARALRSGLLGDPPVRPGVARSGHLRARPHMAGPGEAGAAAPVHDGVVDLRRTGQER